MGGLGCYSGFKGGLAQVVRVGLVRIMFCEGLVVMSVGFCECWSGEG